MWYVCIKYMIFTVLYHSHLSVEFTKLSKKITTYQRDKFNKWDLVIYQFLFLLVDDEGVITAEVKVDAKGGITRQKTYDKHTEIIVIYHDPAVCPLRAINGNYLFAKMSSVFAGRIRQTFTIIISIFHGGPSWPHLRH